MYDVSYRNIIFCVFVCYEVSYIQLKGCLPPSEIKNNFGAGMLVHVAMTCMKPIIILTCILLTCISNQQYCPEFTRHIHTIQCVQTEAPRLQ